MAEVISQTEIGPDLYKLKISARIPQVPAERGAAPGRFCHLQVRQPESWDPLLRRPLSIYNAESYNSELTAETDRETDFETGHETDHGTDHGTNNERAHKTIRKTNDETDHEAFHETDQLEFVYQLRGRGTRLLSQFQAGEQIDCLGPLGSGFTLDFSGSSIILVGGGLGIAPLYFLARMLADNNNLQVYLGAASADLLEPLAADFARLDLRLILATDDGSLGRIGTVFDAFREDFAVRSQEGKNLKQPDYIFACGPEPLLHSLQKYMTANNLPGEFSLEKRMACGSGVCLSCVCQTSKGNQRVCYEGPVFPAREVIFNGC